MIWGASSSKRQPSLRTFSDLRIKPRAKGQPCGHAIAAAGAGRAKVMRCASHLMCSEAPSATWISSAPSSSRESIRTCRPDTASVDDSLMRTKDGEPNLRLRGG
eukprot:scaffold140698_cov33-Tisochrysis_lutea.AAC.2